MLISELIERLQAIQNVHGDVSMYIDDSEWPEYAARDIKFKLADSIPVPYANLRKENPKARIERPDRVIIGDHFYVGGGGR